ncbi:MAG: TRAP transporter large permease [Burkholderiaceae bacterium]
MERELLVILGFSGMFGLMALRVPVAIAMGVTGIAGFGAVAGWMPAINLLANVPLSVITDYNLSVIPMFVLMGAFASYGGMSRELYEAGRTWLGHFRGGLALASVFSCAGFAAINGSSVATTATMTQIALPEMRRGGYDAGLSAGMIAAGGTLGIMIPPSVIFVLYGIMTEIEITELFAAGVIPGLMAVVFYSLLISYLSKKYPHLLPRGEKFSWTARWHSVRGLWAIFFLFLMVLGGIYTGIFTVQEAAGVGAIGALVIGVIRGQLRMPEIRGALVQALRVSSAIMLIVIGAYLFGYFLTVTQFTQNAVEFLVGLPIGAYGVLTLIMLCYLVLGAVMDELAMLLLTVPIVVPAIVALGFDPVWFGVILVMAVTLGLISPPVGMNVFVINSIARDVPLVSIYKGTLPFISMDIIRLIILCAFPALSLWLPGILT